MGGNAKPKKKQVTYFAVCCTQGAGVAANLTGQVVFYVVLSQPIPLHSFFNISGLRYPSLPINTVVISLPLSAGFVPSHEHVFLRDDNHTP